jgi:hypothetical protein
MISFTIFISIVFLLSYKIIKNHCDKNNVRFSPFDHSFGLFMLYIISLTISIMLISYWLVIIFKQLP